MSENPDTFIDKSGKLYRRTWNGRYEPITDPCVEKRDVNFIGEPNVQRGFLGAEPARDQFGRPIYNEDGQPLYQRRFDPTSVPSGAGGSTKTSEFEQFVALGLTFLVVAGVGLIFYVIYKVAVIFWQAWMDFERQRPRLSLTLKLIICMVAV